MITWLKANPFLGTSILMGIIVGTVAILDYIINGRNGKNPGDTVPAGQDNTSNTTQRSVWNVNLSGTVGGAGRTSPGSSPGSAGSTGSASGARVNQGGGQAR